jgi:hypothetical protein
MPDGLDALQAVEVRVNDVSGFDEEDARGLTSGRPRNGNGDGRGLAGLTVRVENVDEGSLGELTVA